jgi:O-acetyl-ADP-ribose deacetylase
MALSYKYIFELPNKTKLVLASGSIISFQSSYENSAIVNAANEECLGGGGVDGAISLAGGQKLRNARESLPKLPNSNIRCPTGEARLTGPGDFENLHVNHVIHAVGPRYHEFRRDEYNDADELLASAYRSSLKVAQDAEIREIVFSLLSAGVYRGNQTLEQVLRIGIKTIWEWAMCNVSGSSVDSVVICAYLDEELETLHSICYDFDLEFKRFDNAMDNEGEKGEIEVTNKDNIYEIEVSNESLS